MIKIIIADDHSIFRDGLKRLLSDDDRFQLLGEGRNGTEALALIAELRPDVAILDLSMPRPDGIEVVEQVAASGSATRCLILTMKEEIPIVRRALSAGARGYVLKEAAFDELAEALMAVAAGRLYLGPLQDHPQLFTSNATSLTRREREVLCQVARGQSSRQIAKILGVSTRTIETHRQNIMDKLGLRSATALVNYAREQGML